MTEPTVAAPAAPPPPAALAGVVITVVVILASVGWVLVGSRFVSATALFGGFLMLWYWAKVEQLVLRRLPAAILGALVGIGLAWGLLYGATAHGPVGLGVGLLVLVIAIYLDIVQTLPLFVNASTMLYVTIAAAPLIQLKVNWIELCLSTAGGGVFFAAIVTAATWAATRLAPKSPQP